MLNSKVGYWPYTQAIRLGCEGMPEPTQVEHLKDAQLSGRLLALSTNIRLRFKGLPVTNTLTFYEHS
jgi:hypothetical protein